MTRLMTARSWAGRSDSRSIGATTSTNRIRPQDDDGFTLAEVIVSIALFVVMSVAATISMVTLIKITRASENRVAATNLGRAELERLRLQNSAATPLDEGQVAVGSGTRFAVNSSLSPHATDPCPSGTSRAVTVTVTLRSNSVQVASFDAVLAC